MSDHAPDQKQWLPEGYEDRPLHRFEGSTAAVLADLVAIEADLKQAKQWFARILDERDETIKFALLSAALIKYRRAFNTGVRKNLVHEDVDDLGPIAPDLHQYLNDMASKFIAHSVNAFEQVAAFVATNDETQEILGIGHFYIYSSAEDPENVKNFIVLIDLILRKVGPRIEQARRNCDAEARALGYSEIKNLPLLSFNLEPPTAAGSKRKPA